MDSFNTDNDSPFWFPGGDQTAAWSETTDVGYGYDRATEASDRGGAGPVTSHNLDWLFAGVLDDLLNESVGIRDPETASAGALNPSSDYPSTFPDMNPLSTERLIANQTYLVALQDFTAACPAATPPLTDVDTVVSTPSEASWDENITPPPQPLAGSQSDPFACISAAEAMPSHAQLALLFEPGQFDDLTPPPYAVGDVPMVAPNTADFNFAGTASTTSHYGSWESVQLNVPPLGVVHVGACQMLPAAYIPASTATILGKHPRGPEETSGDDVGTLDNDNACGLPKRVKRKITVTRVLEAAGSTSIARGTSTLVQVNVVSEAVGCGAGRLATPTAHEVYHQPIPGPSVQELMGTTARGKLPRTEGSEEEAMWHDMSSVAKQQDIAISAKNGERENEAFKIPKRLSERHRRFLRATSDDCERGTVSMLQCRLCPSAAFGKWEDFKRHCDSSEAHPLKIAFCEHCGAFFARTDSLKRHQASRPAECLSVTPAEADAKRRATNNVYEAFKKKLEKCLKNDEEIGTPFAQIIKEIFPSSLKKGSRQQSRLKAPRMDSYPICFSSVFSC